MAIQIDRLETNVEITAPTTAPRPASDAPQPRSVDATSSTVLRDAIGQILAEELAQFRRMRGH